MKKLILLSIPCLCLSALAASLPSGFHSQSSSLSQGRWVKIRVDSTGVYELSAEQLRLLGFRQSDRVAVFGTALVPRPDQFVTDDGKPNIDADLRPVPVMTIGEKLYFYGVGPEWMTFTEANDSTAYFERLNKQIYSNSAFYLLTDSQEPLIMAEAPGLPIPQNETDGTEGTDPDTGITPSPVTPNIIREGHSYVLNDEDLTQGFFSSGQIYIGRRFNNLSDRLVWNVPMPHAVAGDTITLTAAAYADDTAGPTNSNAGNKLVLRAGTYETSGAFPQEDAGQWTNMASGIHRIRNYADRLTLTASISGNRPVGNAGMDYWLLSYPCLASPAIADGLPVAIPVPADSLSMIETGETLPHDAVVWNVADPARPDIMTVATLDSITGIVIQREKNRPAPRPVVFSPSETQKQPSGWEEVTNTDIHAQAAKGADLLIITVPMLNEEAHRLAGIHARYDGMTSIVANVADIYNEYSSGQPSVMAYKSLIKQIYAANGGRHLDVLLLGPLCGNMRGVNADQPVDPSTRIIAYQSDIFPQKGDSHNINEFLGMMDDNITVRMEYASIQVGVGILPCTSKEEAARVVDKVERYINEPNYDLVTSRMMGIGGAGDLQSHIKQTLELKKYVSTYYKNAIIYTPFITETFAPVDQHIRLLDAINSGYSVINYMGHGSAAGMDRAPLINIGYLSGLHNNILPFLTFGMCDATGPDRNIRGMAERMVTEYDDGLIGAIMSTRTAYSNQNASMSRLFMEAMSKPKSSTTEFLANKTIGQVYAEARTQLRTLHENTFALVCDPALKIATPVFNIALEEEVSPLVTIGSRTRLSGSLYSNLGNKVKGFNGRLVGRIMAPARSETCPTLVSGQTIPDNQKAVINYDDQVESTFIGTVTDGVWEITLEPMESQFLTQGSVVRLMLSAYDRTTRTPAAGKIEISLIKGAADPEAADTSAPTIVILSHDADSRRLHFAATDDRSFSFGNHIFSQGPSMSIDGYRYDRLDYSYDISTGVPVTIEGYIPTDNLAPGDHAAEFTVSDNAGNTTTERLQFTIGDTTPAYSLVPDCEVTNTSIAFTVESSGGQAMPRGRLMIADRTGQTVAWRNLEGDSVNFDLCDNQGNRLPQGVYRAWIITETPDRSYSPAINFGILAPHIRQ